MKIYTKTGDRGETSFFGGKRVSKSDPRIEAYGTVDELNAVLGQVLSYAPASPLDEILKTIQHRLFDLGSILATPPEKKKSGRQFFVQASDIVFLEERIDALESGLPPLKQFILPGGEAAGATLHVARTVCRRAERAVVRLRQEEEVEEEVIVYLNRLSDLLFVAARSVNFKAGIPDIVWESE